MAAGVNIRARVRNARGQHLLTVATAEDEKAVAIPPRSTGSGSSVNGGELLLAALATCYCNDVYREAGKRGIAVTAVDVEVLGEFGGEGEPARRITYSVTLEGDASEPELVELAARVDRSAEVQNTLRRANAVELAQVATTSARRSTDAERPSRG